MHVNDYVQLVKVWLKDHLTLRYAGLVKSVVVGVVAIELITLLNNAYVGKA